MIAEALQNLLGPRLAKSLHARGFAELTSVQEAVLDPQAADGDLRITSRTGSGKTVAIGLAFRSTIEALVATGAPARSPAVLVVVPTRELAKQVRDELSWLYENYGLRIACVTGGAGYRDERRALAAGPAVVVGTPGRLVDHIHRGAVDCSGVSTIVLDEADRMLDLGFTEDIEVIFGAAPNRNRTHLVSATLAPEVLRLAQRYQANPRHIQGTRLGEAHADIEHLVHLVPNHHRVDALVNVLLAEPDERTLVFVRTRIDVATTTQQLTEAGFRAVSLSGDMEQPARERALQAFKQNKVRVLVATDVAARGIDIQGMTRVIHLEPPTDPDSYTHRSGRTGRAGQKGASIVFVAPEKQRHLRALLGRARVKAQVLPLPDEGSLRKAAAERTIRELTESVHAFPGEERALGIAEELLRDNDATKVVAMLLARQKSREPEPRHIPRGSATAGNPWEQPHRKRQSGFSGDVRGSNRSDARPKAANRDVMASRPMAPTRFAEGLFPSARNGSKNVPLPPRRSAGSQKRLSSSELDGWGTFHVTWGQLQGADPRRMLAVVCRRGNIRGTDVGAIRIGPNSTIVEVRNDVAAEFAVRVSRPDPDEPRIRITELDHPFYPGGPRDSRVIPGHA